MKQTATLWAWTRRRAARRVPEVVVFSAALAVALLHALDDAFLHREPGVGLGQHALAAAVSLVLGLGAIYAFPFLRPAARAALALFFGALASVNGMLHVKHIAAHGAATSDLTGALALAAGVVLVGLAAAIPWLHRGEGTASRRRRWAYRIAAVPAGLLLALFTVVPIGMAITETHKFREPDRRAAQRRLPRGGVRCQRRRAPLGLVSPDAQRRDASSSSTAAAATAPARSPTPSSSSATATASCCTTPAAAGRARARRTRSAGAGPTTSPGALRFLKSRPEVDPQRIGGLGLSTGADALVQAAGQGANLPRRGRRRDGRRVLRGLAPPAGHHRHDADVRRRVRDGPDHLGREVRAAARGHDQARLASRCCSSPRAGPRSTSSTSSTTARPAAAPSSTGTCPTRTTRRRSATRRPRTSAA